MPRALLGLVLIGACTPHASRQPPPAADAGVTAAPDAAIAAAEAAAAVPEPPALTAVAEPTVDEVMNVLFDDRADLASVRASCPSSLPAEARVRCLYDERYRGDAKAAGLAHELWVRWRIVAGVERSHVMDGGYRGMIRLEPAVPTGASRKHLEWVHAAFVDFDRFFDELGQHGDLARPKSGARPYRFRPVTLRFVRSVGAHTPAAYAAGWTIAYNLEGSINTSADAVRETMFHEIFHLNDAAHPTAGEGSWAHPALGDIFARIVKKCGTATPCLAPLSPGDTMVRGGTFYAFQPGNGVGEYAAELALRYYREERAVLRGLPDAKPFKCGAPDNAVAWGKMRDEFFAGIDVVPACP